VPRSLTPTQESIISHYHPTAHPKPNTKQDKRGKHTLLNELRPSYPLPYLLLICHISLAAEGFVQARLVVYVAEGVGAAEVE
jgi:hypothetical protein